MAGLSVTPQETSPSIAAIVAAVDPTLPAFREQTSPDGMVTIVFTDIEGSTELMERLGEHRYLKGLLTHNRIVRRSVTKFEGEVVKSQGDGFMLAFASASAALGCSVELQRALARYNERKPDESLHMRIGMHTGNIFQSEEDLHGRAVVLAARITGQARGGEILVSEACRAYTEPTGFWRYGLERELQLKGVATPQRASALEWGPPPA
ncbi:MAG: adenylate/guanylate cyclase domain-containing protein [Solirubrobacterales bacterium]|nr:adenylate/guanylate cyclase domain-containing protein [Solirubrobacterales bacterium]